MALRDPRNKSRNNASRRTTSATRSKRSASSARYNPKPTSSSQRSSKTGSSKKVTTGTGGSSKLRQALDTVKSKRTPAKTPPKAKATKVGNLKTVIDAFIKTNKQRAAQDKLDKASKGTKGNTVRTASGSTTKPKPTVKTNPASSTPRGAQGPRTAPQQGPMRRVSGRLDSATKTKPVPKSATPKASNVGPQIRQAKAVKAANPGRTARATRNAAKPGKLGRAAAVAGGLATAGAILKSSGKPGAAKMSRLGLGGNAPVTKPKTKSGPKPTPKKLPVDKKPIKAPPKKGSTVLAKKGGKEGVMRNGVFYQTGWSAAQRNRYQIQKKKNQK